MQEENPDLLIFPPLLGDHADGIEDGNIFSLEKNKLTTYNIMGFIGVNNTELTISSRFQKEESSKDYFLHYMLQKVFSLNIIDFKLGTENESLWDIFLIYLFPFYLNRALNQGLYKEYHSNSYNDTNVKGAIDVTRHFRMNNPFMGKVAYKMREHNYDNRITELIRHTIEFIRSHPIGNNVLTSNASALNAVNQIVYSTTSYIRNNRQTIILKNRKIVNHPFFTEYEILRKICLQILRKEGLTYGKQQDKVYGILFDGAWLWEEYLSTVLSPLDFIHPKNKVQSNAIHLFIDKKYARYPDYYHDSKNIVLDAKYKHLEHYGELDRNDIHQIISYMYVLKSKIGGFIFPYTEMAKIPIGILAGYGNDVNRYGLKIADSIKNYSDFVYEMKKSEEEFCKQICEG